MGKLLNQNLLRKKIKAELIQKIPFRWHMSGIMFTTIALGLVSNYFLLISFNIEQPQFRYPLTALISYLWFFLMIKLYMKFHEFFDGPDMIDVIDVADATNPTWKGGGGEFSGGGSSGSWGVGSSSSSKASSGIDVGLDDGAGVAILVVGIIIAAVFGSSVYVIWQSPEILSEVLIEVFLVARLGKTIRTKNDPNWMFHVLKSTGLAFLFVLIMCLIGGSILQVKCPGTKN